MPPHRNRLVYYGVLAAVVAAGVAFCALAAEKPWDFAQRAAERAAEGKDFPIRWRMMIGLWWGALFNAILATFLIAAGRWLLIPPPPDTRAPAPRTPASLKWLVIANTLAAIAYSAAANAPRLRHSLWGDEETTMRTYVVGEYQRAEGDRLAFRERTWTDTLFNYKVPNNHILYSILARVSHRLLHDPPAADDPDALYFSELAMRLPAYAAGLAAVAALAWFMVRLGFARAAIIGTWILVLHPWYVRYGTEARGYSLLLFLIPCLWTVLLAALRSGLWRWWLLFGLVQFLAFYSHPAAIYLILPTNLAALTMIAFDPRGSAVRGALGRRWFVAGLASTMLVVQLMLPLAPQLAAYLETPRAQGPMGSGWLRDAAAYLTSGIPMRPWDADNPLCVSWLTTFRDHRAIFIALASLAAIALGAGAVRLWVSSVRTRALLAPLLLPAPLMFAHNAISGNYLYFWYLVIALPGAVTVAAIGIEWTSRIASSRRIRDAGLVVASGIAIGAFAFLTAAQRRIYREHPSEPLRESVALTRRILNPAHPDIDRAITIGFHMITKGYDPAHRRAESADDLRRWIEAARTSGRPLHVNFAQEGLARVAHPEIMTLLDDPSLFTEVARIPGLDEQCTRVVLRLADPDSPAADRPPPHSGGAADNR